MSLTFRNQYTQKLLPVGTCSPGDNPIQLCFANSQRPRVAKVSKRNQTDELYEELSRAADAMIEMQQAVDEGLDCIERIARTINAYCQTPEPRINLLSCNENRKSHVIQYADAI